MKDSIRFKLERLKDRFEELGHLLVSPEIINKQDQFRAFSKEYAELEPLVKTFSEFQQAENNLSGAQELMSQESDSEMKQMAEEEIKAAQAEIQKKEQDLELLLLPKDPNDQANIFLEVRAGAGGDEAAIFAGDLYRMYTRYAENKGWTVELVSHHDGEHGGYKEIIAEISGDQVYSQLKFESGAHRVQRVPATEAQGRVHTSTCTVAILPVIDEVEKININPADLKTDTYRASGAGGQHVNKTDSAIRITHIPSGLVVECQDERSQHKNRAKAMALLQSRLLAQAQEAQRATQAQTRRLLVGTGDRSERIRTYNYSQGRLTDHRVNLTLYQLDDILNGNLDPVIQPLIRENQADLLAEMNG